MVLSVQDTVEEHGLSKVLVYRRAVHVEVAELL